MMSLYRERIDDGRWMQDLRRGGDGGGDVVMRVVVEVIAAVLIIERKARDAKRIARRESVSE